MTALPQSRAGLRDALILARRNSLATGPDLQELLINVENFTDEVEPAVTARPPVVKPLPVPRPLPVPTPFSPQVVPAPVEFSTYGYRGLLAAGGLAMAAILIGTVAFGRSPHKSPQPIDNTAYQNEPAPAPPAPAAPAPVAPSAAAPLISSNVGSESKPESKPENKRTVDENPAPAPRVTRLKRHSAPVKQKKRHEHKSKEPKSTPRSHSSRRKDVAPAARVSKRSGRSRPTAR